MCIEQVELFLSQIMDDHDPQCISHENITDMYCDCCGYAHERLSTVLRLLVEVGKRSRARLDAELNVERHEEECKKCRASKECAEYDELFMDAFYKMGELYDALSAALSNADVAQLINDAARRKDGG